MTRLYFKNTSRGVKNQWPQLTLNHLGIKHAIWVTRSRAYMKIRIYPRVHADDRVVSPQIFKSQNSRPSRQSKTPRLKGLRMHSHAHLPDIGSSRCSSVANGPHHYNLVATYTRCCSFLMIFSPSNIH